MSATSSTSLPAPPRYMARLLIGSSLLVALALAVAVTMPYLAGRSRLARLRAIDRDVGITRSRVVPGWIRRILGDKYCDTIDPVDYLNIDVSGQSSLDTIGELNELAAIRLRVCGKAESTAEWLSPVLHLPSLHYLEIASDGALVSASTIRAIAACRELTDLRLDGVALANDWCDGLKDFRCLKNLYISSRELSSSELGAISALPTLELIVVNSRQDNFLLPAICGTNTGRRWCYGTNALTAESLKAIHQKIAPIALGILCSDADEDALSVISEFTQLKSLEVISADAMENPFLSKLGAGPVLSELRIETTNSLGVGLSRLPDLPKLEQLILDVRSLDDEAFESITKYSQLKSLRLRLQFDLADRERMEELTTLEELDLKDDLWPIEALAAACALPNLRWLRFEASTGMVDSLAQIEVASPHLNAEFERAVADLRREMRSPTFRQFRTIEVGSRTKSADQ